MLSRRLIPAAAFLFAAVAFSNGPSQGQDIVLPIPAEPGALNLGPTDGDKVPVNQRMANAIAERLRLSGQLKRYSVEISYVKGLVELSGEVADQTQRDEVIRLVQSLPGVERVRDLLVVTGAAAPYGLPGRGFASDGVLLRTQAAGPELGPPPGLKPPIDQLLPPSGGAPSVGGVPQEPMSILPAMPGAMPNPAYNPPPMPPYAWPTYAPYNNFSRVAYPTLYPYEAWPFIGPMYPFPKVPPGWRSISLTWQDGFWWYGKNATGHDWWRIRYW